MTVAAAAVYCVALVVLAVVDLRERRIPNRIVLPAAALVLALRTAADPTPEWALAALAAAALLLVPALVYPAGLGMGDVKLTLLLGAMLGRDVVAALAVGFAAAGLYALVLLVAGRRGTAFPLAPFLALGGLAALPLAL